MTASSQSLYCRAYKVQPTESETEDNGAKVVKEYHKLQDRRTQIQAGGWQTEREVLEVQSVYNKRKRYFCYKSWSDLL